jgi:long-chain acyl-CoA synthetase
MAELGFWEVAKKRPSMLALVEPDGRGHTAEELFASSNQATHGLRELGLEPGDTVATLLPNSAAQMEAYLACFQSGWYLVPINYHLTASEIAYIVQDCDAAAFISDERFGDTARGAVEEIGFPEDRWFVAGSEDGVRSYDTLKDGQPESLPEERWRRSDSPKSDGSSSEETIPVPTSR